MFFLLFFGLIAVKTPLGGVLGVREVAKAWLEVQSWLFSLALTPNFFQLEGLTEPGSVHSWTPEQAEIGSRHLSYL